MLFEKINGCKLYFDIYGSQHTGKAPVVLVHGSTQTGKSCWEFAAPLLSRNYCVIVPDCRGHGQSTNPDSTYSFRQMAEDIAGLIEKMGHPSAHIIGHSNGGNVALVTLLEHPNIVRSAILQAANAFVSPDLVQREPVIFNPERVSREAPAWRDEMIALHGAVHGEEYWRTLLQITLDEIISEPNYTPDDLHKVQKPVLVIQGENDLVNAPARHAQFIANHIPFSENWYPNNIGHNVHEEILFTWVERVCNFLESRGDPDSEAIYRFKQSHYPDTRNTVFDVRAAQMLSEENNEVISLSLSGNVLYSEQKSILMASLPEQNGAKVVDQVRVLINEETPWSLIHRPVIDLRRTPSNHAERLSQALIGEAVQILKTEESWSWVRLDRDGYIGWLHSSALLPCTQIQAQIFINSTNARVCSPLLKAQILAKTDPIPAEQISFLLPFGSFVNVIEWDREHTRLQLPDGRLGITDSNGLLPQDQYPGTDQKGIDFILDKIFGLTGTPYLWGGRTPFGYDCSGLTQTFLSFFGICAPRDADQQFRGGASIETAPLPGDLLFFGEADTDNPQRFENITHVAISLGGDDFIHANGYDWAISCNSFNPSKPSYRKWLHQNLAGIRRWL